MWESIAEQASRGTLWGDLVSMIRDLSRDLTARPLTI